MKVDRDYKYKITPVYHKGKAEQLTDKPMWFASDSEMTKGSENNGAFNEYEISYNNPLVIDCNYYDYDEVPLNTVALKSLKLYKPEFANKYDYIPDDDDYYVEPYEYGGNPEYDLYTLPSDEIVRIGFKLGYDCIILKNINEMQFHIATDNTDYVVKNAKLQVRKLD